MWARIPIRDKIWALVALLSVLYFAVLSFSNCPWVDGPFAFVRGCKNYGIDWNSFMAPIGFFILCFAAPLSLVYWFLRIFQIGFRSLCFLCVACFIAKGKWNYLTTRCSWRQNRCTVLVPSLRSARLNSDVMWYEAILKLLELSMIAILCTENNQYNLSINKGNLWKLLTKFASQLCQ